MRKIVYILSLLFFILLSPSHAYAAGWNWDADHGNLENNDLTSFTFTWDDKDTRDGGGTITFCQSGYAASDGFQFYSDFSHDEINDLSTGNQVYINDASILNSGLNTISVDCVSGNVVVNGQTIYTNAVSNAGTFNSIIWYDNATFEIIFEPAYTGNYYVSSPVTLGTPAPSPTPSPTPASGVQLFKDTFEGEDGTTLEQHDSSWVKFFPNDITLQSGKATTAGPLGAYFLTGFSQVGNQCVSSKIEAGGVTTNGNVGFGINMNSDVTAGYFGAIRRNSDNTLTWNIYTLGGDQIFVRKTPSQTYDWTQTHMLQFCDLNNALFLIMDGQTLYTTSDRNLFTSGDPLIDIEPSTTIDDFVYSTGIVTGSANQAPTLGTVTVSPSPVSVNSSVSANAYFSDPDTGDTHTATIDWGDGTGSQSATVSESNGSGTITKTHTYTATGVYSVTVTVKDNSNATGINTYQYVVVYDSSPTAGFLTGSGKYDSQAGWYLTTPSAAGQVKFGIQAKYTANNTTPTGQTKWNFKNGDLDFVSTSYDWLVVNGAKATLKGHGTINGAGNYTFLASGIDSSQAGGTDKIRFQIKNASGNLVYDSQQGAADTADPTTTSTGGNIKVH